MNEHKQQIKVLVSHPVGQHVHHMCYALQGRGFLQQFYTSVWYSSNSFLSKLSKFLPSKAGNKLFVLLSKRHSSLIDSSYISTFPYFEIARQLFAKKSKQWLLWMYQIHDVWVAQKINKLRPNIVVGYESSSLYTFKFAKKKDVVTILDLASVHYQQNISLYQTFRDYADLVKSEELFIKENKIKEEEYKNTDYFLTPSTYSRDTLVNSGVDKNKIFIINYGIDPTNFTPKENYKKEGKFTILFVGRISKLKGIRVLITAFEQLQNKDIELIVVGPPDNAFDIIEAHKDKLQYFPYMCHSQLVKIYQSADVFISPSYTDSWAMTVVEAMACGTPVIVTENTGSKDVVVQGGGFIVPVDDVEALKEKILLFYKNREEVERVGRQAHTIASQYTWQRYYEQVQDVIQEIYTKENKN